MEATRDGRKLDITGRGGKPPIVPPVSVGSINLSEDQGGVNVPKLDALSVPKQVEGSLGVQKKWSDVMDVMKASIPTRGKFAVEVGARPYKYDQISGKALGIDEDKADNRAMILIESRKEGLSEQVFTVITRNGAQEIRFNKEEGDEMPAHLTTPYPEGGISQDVIDEYRNARAGKFTLPEIMRRLTDGDDFLEVGGEMGFSVRDGIGHITFGRLPAIDKIHKSVKPVLRVSIISYTATPIDNMDLVQKALDASYESARLNKASPNSLEAKALRAKSIQADSILAMVQGLPPKK